MQGVSNVDQLLPALHCFCGPAPDRVHHKPDAAVLLKPQTPPDTKSDWSQTCPRARWHDQADLLLEPKPNLDCKTHTSFFHGSHAPAWEPDCCGLKRSGIPVALCEARRKVCFQDRGLRLTRVLSWNWYATATARRRNGIDILFGHGVPDCFVAAKAL